MKKVLLGTSAIALAGAFASQASAAEWTVKVGGYMEQQIAITDTDDSMGGADFNGVDTISDSEVHFTASITLDNGIKFGARMELEGVTNSDQIDENYMFIEGAFGRIVLGEDDNAAYSMAYGAPDVTFVNINSGSDTGFMPFSAAFGTTSTYPSVEGDSAGIHYFTPRMAGFQLGASYARDANRSTNETNQDENAAGGLFNIWAVGANYVNTIGDVSIAASAGYTRGSRNGVPAVMSAKGVYISRQNGGSWTFNSETVDGSLYSCSWNISTFPNGDNIIVVPAVCSAAAVPSTDPTAYAFGLNVGFGGFTVGGSYANYDETGSDRKVYDAGVSYETGPWGFSFTWLHSKQDVSKNEIDKFLAGVNYNLAKGVNVGAWGIYEDLDVKSGQDMDGFVIGTGVKLSF